MTDSDVRSTPRLDWQRVRGLAGRLTTPLHPDDYLSLINPLWSARELRGRIEKVVPETEDSATLAIRPGWGWSFDHQAGQYIGIGVEIDGRFHWRSYSLSSVPTRSRGLITITVRAMPEGFLSDHLVRGLAPGTIVRLAAPAGEFTLPNPPPAKTLFLVGGSGITPVISMLRTLDRRGTMPDAVLIYSSPTEDRMIFRDELRGLHDTHPGAARRRAVHRPAGHVRPPRARHRLPRLARARHLGVRPGTDARRRRGALARGRTSRTSCTSSGSPSTSAAATPRAARSPSPTPASRSRSTARPRCSRPARRPASACPTAAASASATPARS